LKKNPKIWLSSPHMSGKEQEFIDLAFKENSIAPVGSNISGFEDNIEYYLKQDCYASALNSGTAAIHLALILLGVTKNDEVICQSKTFVATVNPVLYLGAIPILVDSEVDTWNLNPELLELALIDRISNGKKPKAIIAVHLYGMPYKVQEIHSIAKKYEIPIIEDCAEAFGSSYKNRKCGTFGEFSILSFNGNKIITTSGGGVLITKSKDTKEKAIYLSTQAKDESPEYSHSQIGYNYRMSNIAAGIGRGQMTVLDNYVNKRRENYDFYNTTLEKYNSITFLDEPEDCFSNRWLTCILTESLLEREELRIHLTSENIDCRPLWKPMHQQSTFKRFPKYLNGVSDDLFKKGLCLPSGSNLTEKDFERITKSFSEFYG